MRFMVTYTGKESHASIFPELGINALDALTVAQTAICASSSRRPPVYTACAGTAATLPTSYRNT